MSVFPLYMKDLFGYQVGLVMATLIGFGFGFVLERSGFGRAPVLASQFYFVDTRVLKVMFSAIVTALLGATLLSGLGILDMSAVQVPETFLWAQIVGGFILGVGFIISGYCPGTSVVAAASGNLDGALAVLGVILGSVTFGFFPTSWRAFADSGAMGVSRLTEVLHTPQAWLALGVALMAMGAFVGAEWMERWTAGRRGEPAPCSPVEARRKVFIGFAVAAALGLVTTVLPSPGTPAPAQVVAQGLSPDELARILVTDPTSIYLVDVRDQASYQASHLPGAQSIHGLDLASLSSARTLVVYGGEVPPALRRFPVMRLDGYEEFRRGILEEPQLPKEATPQQIADYRWRSALHNYFTGSAAAAPPSTPIPVRRPTAPSPKKGSGC